MKVYFENMTGERLRAKKTTKPDEKRFDRLYHRTIENIAVVDRFKVK
jgi:hypothetical protein